MRITSDKKIVFVVICYKLSSEIKKCTLCVWYIHYIIAAIRNIVGNQFRISTMIYCEYFFAK